jgi:hypothetical protein
MARKSGATPRSTKRAAKKSISKALGGPPKKKKPMSGPNILRPKGGKK